MICRSEVFYLEDKSPDLKVVRAWSVADAEKIDFLAVKSQIWGRTDFEITSITSDMQITPPFWQKAKN